MLHSYKFYRLVSKEGVKFDHIRILRMESLSFAEAPYGRFLKGARGAKGRGKGRHSPRAAGFPLPRPTAKKPLRSKQHDRGLSGRERYGVLDWDYIAMETHTEE